MLRTPGAAISDKRFLFLIVFLEERSPRLRAEAIQDVGVLRVSPISCQLVSNVRPETVLTYTFFNDRTHLTHLTVFHGVCHVRIPCKIAIYIHLTVYSEDLVSSKEHPYINFYHWKDVAPIVAIPSIANTPHLSGRHTKAISGDDALLSSHPEKRFEVRSLEKNRRMRE